LFSPIGKPHLHQFGIGELAQRGLQFTMPLFELGECRGCGMRIF
jgi:hypothetical protein